MTSSYFQKVVAHIILVVWPTKWALRILKKYPYNE